MVVKGVEGAVEPADGQPPDDGPGRETGRAEPRLRFAVHPHRDGDRGRGRGAGRIRDAAARRAVVGGHVFARRQPEITARAGVPAPVRGRAPASRRSAAPVGLCSTSGSSTGLTGLPRPSGPTSHRYATRAPLSLVSTPVTRVAAQVLSGGAVRVAYRDVRQRRLGGSGDVRDDLDDIGSVRLRVDDLQEQGEGVAAVFAGQPFVVAGEVAGRRLLVIARWPQKRKTGRASRLWPAVSRARITYSPLPASRR